jgi:hypothetical protein
MTSRVWVETSRIKSTHHTTRIQLWRTDTVLTPCAPNNTRASKQILLSTSHCYISLTVKAATVSLIPLNIMTERRRSRGTFPLSRIKALNIHSAFLWPCGRPLLYLLLPQHELPGSLRDLRCRRLDWGTFTQRSTLSLGFNSTLLEISIISE